MNEAVLPLEETDPELGEFIEDLVNGRKPHGIQSVYMTNDDAYFRMAPGVPVRSAKIGRNQPCICNSGKKHKKCCGKGG